MSTPNIVITPSLNDAECTNTVYSYISSLLLPHLPPHHQQRLSHARFENNGGISIRNEVFSQYIRLLSTDNAIEGGSLVLVDSNLTFTPLSTINDVQLSNSIAFSMQQTRPTSSEVEDTSEEHSVIQAQDSLMTVKVLKAMNSDTDGGLLHLRVKFQGSKSADINVPNGLTGLQLKSFVISSLDLDGGFQDYYLTLGGTPFGSRVPIGSHPLIEKSFLSQDVPVLDLEVTGARPKAVGHT